MDIEEAFREAAAQTGEVLNDDDVYWLDEIAADFWRDVPEGGDTSEATKALCRIAFLAGIIFQADQAPQADTPESVDEKFRLISGFIDLVRNNRTGE